MHDIALDLLILLAGIRPVDFEDPLTVSNAINNYHEQLPGARL